jgi:hypothetical protein
MKGLAIGLAVALVTVGSATAAFVVTSKNIKNGTIQLVDISPKAKEALRGQRGPQGIQAITEVRSPEYVVRPGKKVFASATCPLRQRPIAGGFQVDASVPGPVPAVALSKRIRRGWGVAAQNSGAEPGGLIAYVYCSQNVTLLP